MAKAVYIGVNPFLSEGHTQLEYIESTGTQHINCGYIPNSFTRVVMEGVFTAPTSAENYDPVAFGAESSGDNRFGFSYNTDMSMLITDASSRGFADSIVCDGGKHIVDCSASNFTVDEINYFNGNLSARPSCNLFLFAYNYNGTAMRHTNMKLYSCKIYDNGTLVRDFVPARNHSGVVGLYDLVYGKFYPNSGSSYFKPGEEVIDVAKESKKLYLGDENGLARRVFRGYIGDENGIARMFWDTRCKVTITGKLYPSFELESGYYGDGDVAVVTINGTTYKDTLTSPVVIEVPYGTDASFTLYRDDSYAYYPYITLNGDTLKSSYSNFSYNYKITTDTKIELESHTYAYRKEGSSSSGSGNVTSVLKSSNNGVAHITTY